MMSVSEEVPMKYESLLKKSEILHFKVQCTSAIGAMVKEKVLKFSGKESVEHYLLCIKTINMLAK
eukprot:13796506-Ditylum_brightwellii.AAC.1